MFINELLNHIRDFFVKIPHEIKIAAANSLQITTAIKNILANPVADIVTDIIPGDWDIALKALILKYIDQALPYLLIVDGCKQDDLNAMLLCWITEVRKQPTHVQDALLLKLAALLTALQHEHKLSQSLYDTYTQLVYASKK